MHLIRTIFVQQFYHNDGINVKGVIYAGINLSLSNICMIIKKNYPQIEKENFLLKITAEKAHPKRYSGGFELMLPPISKNIYSNMTMIKTNILQAINEENYTRINVFTKGKVKL